MRPAGPLCVVVLVALVLHGCKPGSSAPDDGEERIRSDAWEEMERAEELIRELGNRLSAMSRSVLNLQLPDDKGRQLLAPSVAFRDIAGEEPTGGWQLDQLEISQREWPLAPEQDQRAAPANLRLWDPLLSQVDYFHYAKFKLAQGRFSAADTFDSDVKFSGLARLKSRKLSWIRSDLTLRWHLEPTEDDGEDWRIAQWQTDSFTVLDAGSLLFREVLDQVISDPDKLRQARRSLHEELVARWLANPKEAEVPEHFDAPAMDRHPGIAVVDIDQDGMDDLYVMARWGKNILLRNRGDGTFDEQAAEVGLDLDGYTAAAIFADFDNDGDRDAFLGRTLRPSSYLENVGGRFVDRSADLDTDARPYLASSVSVVDYNQDGLLDVYVATYAVRLLEVERRKHVFRGMLLSDFISPADASRLFEMVRDTETLIPWNWPGPPNVLLRNEGRGRFVPADDAPNLRVFTNTYQATWSDYDGDGDQDVYLANDFGPNNLFRNDGGGAFVDVTEATGTADIGFGMGATWGDYDHDGRHDLYVSNMYSTAGRRIAQQFDNLDRSIPKMARGNTLFRNEVDRFHHVSSYRPPGLLVEDSGWAWGGQFVDVDNDTFLDLISLAGYYTAPIGFRDRPDI